VPGDLFGHNVCKAMAGKRHVVQTLQGGWHVAKDSPQIIAYKHLQADSVENATEIPLKGNELC